MREARWEKERFRGEIKAEDTVRTRAAKKLIDVAELLGVLERLFEQLSRRYGNIFASTANSPCQGERRKSKWHGQEDQGKGTEFLDRIDTESDGESSQCDRTAQEIIERLERKPKPKK